MTSSIRTRSIDEEQPDISTVVTSTSSKKTIQSSELDTDCQSSTNCSAEDQIKEILLCLRPIQDGAEKVSENLRFIPKSKNVFRSFANNEGELFDSPKPNEFFECNSENDANGKENKADKDVDCQGITRKRPLPISEDSFEESHVHKKQAAQSQDDEAEKSVVESLIMMSSN